MADMIKLTNSVKIHRDSLDLDGGAMKMTLLWSNSAPKNNITATIDLKKYKYVNILMSHYGQRNTASLIVPVPWSGTYVSMFTKQVDRSITVSTSSVSVFPSTGTGLLLPEASGSPSSIT